MINFCEGEDVWAKIYRHCDGYPDTEHGVLADLNTFFDAITKQTPEDSRFGDPEYLAARFIVWQADQYCVDWRGNKRPPLAFLSLGVSMADHGDVEYLYFVDCQDGSLDATTRPVIRWEKYSEG